MDSHTFDQRLAIMHDHEAKLSASLGQSRARERVLEKRTVELEGRARDLQAVSDLLQRASVQVTSEPLTYRKGGEASFFYDLARARRSVPGARQRLERHQREMETELPRRAQLRARAAQAAYEAAFCSTPEERKAVDEMLAAGREPFEMRGLSTTPGQGGYLAPPLWLVDEYVSFARSGSPFASSWHQMDLPRGIDEIAVPRLALGAAVGPQADLGPVTTRDISDSLAVANVRTISGHADAAIQWLEQGAGSAGFGVDELIFADLTADIAENTEGQALLGSGTNGQLLGVWPAGAIAAANGIIQADTNTASGQTWTVASAGNSLHVNAAQLVSLCRRIRNRADGWSWYWHPFAWSVYTAQTDSQGRPLVNDQDASDLPAGVVGYYQNLPVRLSPAIPTTFGGTTAPYIGALSNGQYPAYAGTGTGASYSPLLLARPGDLFLWAGDIQLQLLEEILSGSLQARFQARQYIAAMPNRYVAAAAVGSSVSAGGDVAHGTLTWQETESLLILSGSGY